MSLEPGTTRRILLVVKRADPLAFEGDALVLPTISDGHMGEGLAARVKAAAGQVVEDEVKRLAPIAVGAAVVTGAGVLSVQRIIHVPLSEEPGIKVGVENIRRATRAGLLAANHYQLERVAFPGIGYGEMGVPCDEAARAMVDEVRAFRGSHPLQVALLDLDAEMVDAFKEEAGIK